MAYTSEIFPGAGHGYAVENMPVYDKTAAEQHWTALLALLDKTLNRDKVGGRTIGSWLDTAESELCVLAMQCV